MAELGLNDYYQSIVKNYMSFARYQRLQNLKTVDMSFQDVLDAQLLESTYTQQEVSDILSSLREVVRREMETELISVAHTNVLLLSQLFSQSEKWHLRLNVDLSEIQNRELLEHVQALEATDLTSKCKLEPLNAQDGSEMLLRNEIERLQQEQSRLQKTVEDLERQVITLKEERNKLLSFCERNEEEVIKLKKTNKELISKLETSAGEKTVVEPTSETKQDVEHLLGEYEAVLSEQLSAELESMRQQVLCVQSQLSLAEQELERKFNQTAAYSNMKKMLTKKNEQVKELRKKLLQHEPLDDSISDD